MTVTNLFASLWFSALTCLTLAFYWFETALVAPAFYPYHFVLCQWICLECPYWIAGLTCFHLLDSSTSTWYHRYLNDSSVLSTFSWASLHPPFTSKAFASWVFWLIGVAFGVLWQTSRFEAAGISCSWGSPSHSLTHLHWTCRHWRQSNTWFL